MSESSVELGIAGISSAIPIGAGGAATVYRASQDRLYRDVAVKVMHAASNDATLRRFEREVQALGQLSGHSGIVSVHEVGKTPADQPYIVMQLCLNGSLEDRLKEHGTLDSTEVCATLATVADTLADAHDRGIIHRDIKPGNILINDQQRPLVADFGIAALETVSGGVSTAVAFSPGFVPPETLDGSPPTAAGDVYSLGSTAYALTTGRLPYAQPDGEMNLLQLIARMTADEMDDPRQFGVSEEVAGLIELATQRDPSARPTMREFAALLRSGGSGSPIASDQGGSVMPISKPTVVTAPPPQPEEPPDSSKAPPTEDYSPPAVPPAPPRRVPVIAGLAIVAVAAIAVAVTLALTRTPSTTETISPLVPTPSTEIQEATTAPEPTAGPDATQAPDPTAAPAPTERPEPTQRPTATPRPEPTQPEPTQPALISSPDCSPGFDLLLGGRSDGGGQSPSGVPGDIRIAICVGPFGDIEYFGLNLTDGLDIRLYGCEQASGVWVLENNGWTYQIIDQSVGDDERALVRLTSPRDAVTTWPISQSVGRNPSLISESDGFRC